AGAEFRRRRRQAPPIRLTRASAPKAAVSFEPRRHVTQPKLDGLSRSFQEKGLLNQVEALKALAIHLVDQPFQYYGGTLATFPDGPAQPRHGNSHAHEPDEYSADDGEEYAPAFHRRESGGEDRRNPDATAGGVEHFFALVRQVCCERHQRPPRFRFSDRQFNQ